jgi:hypothetical protein
LRREHRCQHGHRHYGGGDGGDGDDGDDGDDSGGSGSV